MLDPVDVYVLLKVAAKVGEPPWTQGELALELEVSPSVVNRTLKKAERLRIFRSVDKRLMTHSLEMALVHGARLFLAPEQGGEVRGTLTAWAAPPLSETLVSGDNLPPVWPNPTGDSRGISVTPLHKNAPIAALRDEKFYELLALVDGLRLGGSRERALAAEALHDRLRPKGVA